MASYGVFGYGTYSCTYAGTSLCDERCGSYDRCQGSGDWSGKDYSSKSRSEDTSESKEN